MKMILFKILIMALLAAIFPACIDKGENASLPKEEETPTPSKPEDEPDFSQLTADNHPRLLMNADDFAELKNKLKSRESAHLALLHNTIIDLCNSKGMNTDELVYKLDDSNKRILDVSRDALLRIFTCAYAYRMTGENKYLLKAERDMNAVCNFSDWNAKRHFLDVAEMATAIAFGYDWLYHDLSEMTRTKASDALLKFAIQQAQRKNWNLNFYEATNNWNQVCNGGLVCAAVAAFENYPLEARNIIEKAVVSNKPALQVMYAPDGNYPEGSGYWCYGTLYQVLMLAALDENDHLEVTDKLQTGDKEVDISWIMLTPANAKVTGENQIELSKRGRRMLLVVDADTEVRMKILSNDPPHDYDFRNPGTVRVGFDTVIPANQVSKLRVRLIPN